MFKNKNINFSDLEIDENELLKLTKYCEWKGCEEKGEYKAPSSREELRVFKWFCLKHVKMYNKGWDYFKGRSSEEINNELSEDARWHRKTSKKIKNKVFSEDFVFEEWKSEQKVNKKKEKLCENQFIKNALDILNMEMPNNLADLKKQYKIMVKKFHPDINKIKDQEKIIKLNEAYSVLLSFFKS